MNTKQFKFWLFLAILINFFLTLSLTPLFNLDEGAFSEATREMLHNHNYITTFLNGEYRFDKPILIYWLQLLSIKIFGINEFAFRLPSAIAATFWTLGIYFFTKKMYNEKTALISSFLMVTTLQIGLIAKAAIADSLLNMFIAFCMFSIYLYLKEKKEKYLLFAFAFIGFGTLTKGPVAIMIPLVVTFIYMALKKEIKEFFKMVFNIKGIIIFLIIALPWYIAEYMQTGDKFIEGFILKHNLHRFTSPMEHHRGNYFYYIPVVLIGLIPWSSLFIAYLIKLKNLIKNDFVFFGSIWFFFVFLFFSLSGTKLPHYVIYGYTPLFIFMALMVEKIREIYLSFPLILFILLLLALPFVLENVKNTEVYLAYIAIRPYFNWFYFLSFIILLILSFIKMKEFKIVFLGFASIFILNYIGWIYAHARAIPVKEAAVWAKKHNIKKVYLKTNLPSFSVYFNKITPKEPKKGEIALLKITKTKGYKIIYKKGLIALGVKK
ncbi:glycosyltransferase family 39 protein [Lebetimonas sp. JH292]|uniref:ArnT family glycosyltransferase n=1 Tax=Lebetimonas sp. JH292 TaxID=990068 RepID=UPI000463A60B|nr:glycosyltransferase family 39 protein [Lebetimonas sp. JH292]